MKFIELEVLCVVTEDSSYNNLLNELNIKADENTYWKTINFNLEQLEQEIYAIEERKDEPLQSVITFYGSDATIVVNSTVKELKKKLEK
jgi:hypothetical protein